MHLTLVWLVEILLNPAVDLAVLLQRSHPIVLLEVMANGRCVCSVALNYISFSRKTGRGVFDPTKLYRC